MAAHQPPTHGPSAGSAGLAAVLGGLAGAAVTSDRRTASKLVATAAGAICLASVDSVARQRQQPGEVPPPWARIAASGAIAAVLGWSASRVTGAGPLPVGT